MRLSLSIRASGRFLFRLCQYNCKQTNKQTNSELRGWFQEGNKLSFTSETWITRLRFALHVASFPTSRVHEISHQFSSPSPDLTHTLLPAQLLYQFLSNSRQRDTIETMASVVRSRECEALQKSFKDNIATLRNLIRDAAWENDTLVNTTQQHLSKSPCDKALHLTKHSQGSTRRNWMSSRLQSCAGARDFIQHQRFLTSGLSRNYFEHFGA